MTDQQLDQQGRFTARHVHRPRHAVSASDVQDIPDQFQQLGLIVGHPPRQQRAALSIQDQTVVVALAAVGPRPYPAHPAPSGRTCLAYHGRPRRHGSTQRPSRTSQSAAESSWGDRRPSNLSHKRQPTTSHTRLPWVPPPYEREDQPGEKVEPATSPTHRSAPRSSAWSASPEHVGPSRKSSRPPRTSAALTSTKSAATPVGCGTSPWPCWRTPSWRSWPPTLQQKGQQKRFLPRAPHRGRSSAAPGNWPPTRHTRSSVPHQGTRTEMVKLAQTTPSHLPPLSLSAAAAHDRGAVREREHGPEHSPLHSPRPPLNRENVKVLLEY